MLAVVFAAFSVCLLVSQYGGTVLITAANNGYIDIMKVLLNAGADANATCTGDIGNLNGAVSIFCEH
jgi:ankyrin repeat protein